LIIETYLKEQINILSIQSSSPPETSGEDQSSSLEKSGEDQSSSLETSVIFAAKQADLQRTYEEKLQKVKLHSKRVEKMKKYTRNEWRRCKTTLETSGEDIIPYFLAQN
jgi:hypothetical protein